MWLSEENLVEVSPPYIGQGIVDVYDAKRSRLNGLYQSHALDSWFSSRSVDIGVS